MLFPAKGIAQSVIALDSCGRPYIDPQEANDDVTTGPTLDTLAYRTYFADPNTVQAYYVDINAFGGRQPDRARVFAIMPDSSRKELGALAFGTCADCVDGFAFVNDGELLVSGVTDRNTMDMWLQSLNQPSFALPGNLQTLTGVGRISGRTPFCAVGLYVEYVVSSNPATSSTEFSTYILCPEPVSDCRITYDNRVDCVKDSIYLEAVLPAGCFSGPVSVSWRTPHGEVLEGPSARLPLSGNQGLYLVTIEDECCRVVDSVRLESPAFTDAGPDQVICRGATATLTGSGGAGHFWDLPGGGRADGAQLVLADVQPEQQGPYVLHAFNDDGCEATDTLALTVRVPAEPQVIVADACLGDDVSLSLANPVYATVTWLDPQGNTLAQPVIPDLQPEDMGQYTVIAVDSFGCEVRREFAVTGSLPPEVEYLIEESCDSTRVYARPDTYRFDWENGTTGPVFASAAGGTFTVTVTDVTGCASVDQVDLPQPDGPDASLEVTQPRCPTDFGVIDITLEDPDRPAIFSIDGGTTYSITPSFGQLNPGSYSILVQDELGCLTELKTEIVAPDTLGVSLNYNRLEVRPTTPVTLYARTVGNVQRYQWVPEEINTEGPVSAFTATTDMDVRLIVEDERGCRASAGFPLTIVLGPVYVPNAFSPNQDGDNDRFTFYSDNGSGEIIESLLIFDRWGDLVFTTEEIPLNDEEKGWDGTRSGKLLSPAVFAYYGVVRFGNGARKVFKGDVTLMR